MNTPEKSDIMTLAEILDAYEQGILDMTESARKYYITEKDKYFNKVSWIHNDELKNQALLRGMSKTGGRDLLREIKNPLQK
jgi:hypothetical protein